MTMTALPAITIRRATSADGAAVVRVAQRDSRRTPHGDMLVAEVDGTMVAALALPGGYVVADPFRPTAEAVALLRERGRRLATARGPRRGLRRRAARPAAAR